MRLVLFSLLACTRLGADTTTELTELKMLESSRLAITRNMEQVVEGLLTADNDYLDYSKCERKLPLPVAEINKEVVLVSRRKSELVRAVASGLPSGGFGPSRPAVLSQVWHGSWSSSAVWLEPSKAFCVSLLLGTQAGAPPVELKGGVLLVAGKSSPVFYIKGQPDKEQLLKWASANGVFGYLIVTGEPLSLPTLPGDSDCYSLLSRLATKRGAYNFYQWLRVAPPIDYESFTRSPGFLQLQLLLGGSLRNGADLRNLKEHPERFVANAVVSSILDKETLKCTYESWVYYSSPLAP